MPVAGSVRGNDEHRFSKQPAAGAQPRGRLLIIEPDPLTRWSMSTYLKRWFEVVALDSVEAADQLHSAGSVAALIIADELPAEQSRFVEQQARRRNPDLITVHTVTEVAREAASPDEAERRLEKPFELASLARLLGVPEAEIPP
jgi:hypothetical protein